MSAAVALKMEELEAADVGRACRACLMLQEDMISLLEPQATADKTVRIDEMLMACTGVQVTQGDGLPMLICQECFTKLSISFSFKAMCEQTDKDLQSFARKNNVRSSSIATDLHHLQRILDGKEEIKEESNPIPKEALLKCDYIEIFDSNLLILTCRQCFKVFTSVDGLKSHKKAHNGTTYKCKVCDKEYMRLNHLQRHEVSHLKRKIHVCKICNKTLIRYEHLKRHLVSHLREKPYACSKCPRGFTRAEHLEQHVARCKGDRIHICDICNKGFNRADSLEVHRKMHENSMPVMPTLENLDNISEHYIELDQEDGSFFQDDVDDDDDFADGSDFLEPQVSITEKVEMEEEEEEEGNQVEITKEEMLTIIESLPSVKETIKIEHVLDHGDEMDDKPESVIEAVLEGATTENIIIQHEDMEVYSNDYIQMDSDNGSVHSEYTPTKVTPKVKRGRGRPRKNFGATKKKYGRRGRPPKNRIREEPENDDDYLIDGEGEYPCPLCSEMCTTMLQLEKHGMKMHDGDKVFECKTCSKFFAKAMHLKRHMISHSEHKPYNCEICTKGFNRRDHLAQHLKLHSQAHEHECDLCDRGFSRIDHLHKHKANKHGEGERVIAEKKYKCAVCQKGFTTEKYRDVHMKAHSGEKKYRCKTCDKLFLSKSHLNEHLKFHSEHSKKFLCSECGQRFIRNDYLVIHMRRHRGEKPFKCKYCGKGFPRTTDLTVHERYHTGEKTHLCVVCGRGFGRAYNLTVHMRTHTGEKPYQCSYCDAAFAQGNDLKAHVRRHTGERFQCDMCPDTFLMGYLLTQHKRSVHGMNVVSNIRRLQPTIKQNPDDPPPITISLPAPAVPTSILTAQLRAVVDMNQTFVTE